MSDVPALELRPKYYMGLFLIQNLLVHLFLTFWAGMFFGTFGTFLIPAGFEIIGLEPPKVNYFLVIGVAVFIFLPIIRLYLTKKNYELSSFKFYEDRVEFLEGFLTKQRKTVYYDQVSEVSLTEGFFQRQYSLGTIVLSTRATSAGEDDSGKSGVRVNNVENSEALFDQVKKIVKRK